MIEPEKDAGPTRWNMLSQRPEREVACTTPATPLPNGSASPAAAGRHRRSTATAETGGRGGPSEQGAIERRAETPYRGPLPLGPRPGQSRTDQGGPGDRAQ